MIINQVLGLGLEIRMYLNESLPGGGGFFGPSCRSCKRPILQDEPSTRIAFDSDPHGAKGLTGDYHMACSKPFSSLAHAINALSRFGR
jgi:hypothetical protein